MLFIFLSSGKTIQVSPFYENLWLHTRQTNIIPQEMIEGSVATFHTKNKKCVLEKVRKHCVINNWKLMQIRGHWDCFPQHSKVTYNVTNVFLLWRSTDLVCSLLLLAVATYTRALATGEQDGIHSQRGKSVWHYFGEDGRHGLGWVHKRTQ